MRLSAKGLDLIAKFEGFRSRAYKPVAAERFWTIGYGHYGPDVRPTDKITRAEARALLRRDVRRFEQAVERLVRVPINQNRFDALVSLCYNIGEGNFASSTVLRKLNKGDYKGAGRAFRMWVRGADGKILLGLVRRRAAEWRLYRKRPKKKR